MFSRPLLFTALSLLCLLYLPADLSPVALAEGEALAKAGLPQGSLAAGDQPTLVSLFIPTATTRPTYRATQAKGKVDKKRKLPTITTKAPREYRDLVNGFKVEYPNDWSTDFSAPDTGVAFANVDWVFFGSTAPQYHSTFLAVGVLDLKKPVTTADLEKNFADYTREPKYAEQFQDPRFLLMYELISSKRSTWKDRVTLDSTFTHRWQSRNTKERQIRIPAGNRIIILRFSAVADWFDQDLHFFEDFKKSFGLLR